MRRVGKNSFTEIYFPGCNPSFVETSDGYVMIDSPQIPMDAMRWRERMKQTDPDSVWLVGHPDYPPANPPKLTFTDTLTLHVGDHTFNIIHHPGHTAPQTSIHVPEEGVVFTGDNVFHKCRTWLQECDPWEWLAALDALAALDVETIVPGHGEPCGKEYLKEQAQIVDNWVGLVERFVDRGISAEDALREPIAVTKQDPYPIGQRLFPHDERLTGLIVRNLYKRIAEKKQARAS